MAKRRPTVPTKKTRPRPPRPLARAVTAAADWKPAFLAALVKSGHVTRSCEAAGVSRDTAYEHRRADEAFGLAWAEALAAYGPRRLDALEEELDDRILRGIPEPVIHQGELCFGYREKATGRYVELGEESRAAMAKLPSDKARAALVARAGLERVPLVVYRKEFAPLAMALKAADRRKYSDRVQHHHEGKLDVIRSPAEGAAEASALLAELRAQLGVDDARPAAAGQGAA
jgi:hypothetical protein